MSATSTLPVHSADGRATELETPVDVKTAARFLGISASLVYLAAILTSKQFTFSQWADWFLERRSKLPFRSASSHQQNVKALHFLRSVFGGLVGDFHEDIRSNVIRLINPNPTDRNEDLDRPGTYIEGVASAQNGKVGDITAGLSLGPRPVHTSLPLLAQTRASRAFGPRRVGDLKMNLISFYPRRGSR